jgi:hypothetical protein
MAETYSLDCAKAAVDVKTQNPSASRGIHLHANGQFQRFQSVLV